MKTMLIPTDFSPAANNAAHYAFQLGKGIKADLKLCYAIMLPVEAAMGQQVAWPLMDYSTLQKEGNENLGKLSVELQTKNGPLVPAANEQHPVHYAAEIGTLREVVKQQLKKEKAGLVVMGTSGAGALSRFFLGSSSRELMDHADFPILLVPPGAEFKGIKKIAFATDLSEADIALIHSLSAFARPFNAEILIVHVTPVGFNSDVHQDKIDAFLNEVTCKVNYPKIYYRHVKDMSVDEGLNWLTEHVAIDLLAMVHRRHHFMQRIFEGSRTKKMAGHLKLPLLVFPSETPVFL
ncbi:Nucleotide-binding universal stress protein, UspA family [Pedobacter steynii]|uniref:Nucleotide-binding universal stress protein, UspA family n=1 Tax=Pedobacter steynii TaxID=430522 RepID=A0A1H0AEH0_9SPHI|nr:universal stress protein [Pedobacter steynii]NQX41388.1 universal stress protein [Pedobacter steynii]SDN31724.1 Nucleotide-binding universal stress protein, UspA family [Pedobacter steynii]